MPARAEFQMRLLNGGQTARGRGFGHVLATGREGSKIERAGRAPRGGQTRLNMQLPRGPAIDHTGAAQLGGETRALGGQGDLDLAPRPIDQRQGTQKIEVLQREPLQPLSLRRLGQKLNIACPRHDRATIQGAVLVEQPM